MAIALRITHSATPEPHVRTVPSPATVSAHDASGAMVAAASCTKPVIHTSIADRELRNRSRIPSCDPSTFSLWSSRQSLAMQAKALAGTTQARERRLSQQKRNTQPFERQFAG